MSNDKATKRELAISVVRFRGLVDIGIRAEEGWQAIGGSEANRKTTCEDKGNHLLFVYQAGEDYQEIEVPKSNVASIKRIPRERLEAKKNGGSL